MAKSAVLGIKADGKKMIWVQVSIRLRVNDQPICALAPGKFYKYMGVRVGTLNCGQRGLPPYVGAAYKRVWSSVALAS